jgi:transcriptional regulator with XRE-family HTH domain
MSREKLTLGNFGIDRKQARQYNKKEIIIKGGLVEIEGRIIGHRIKECRDDVGFSQKSLAQLIDVSPSAVNQYEKGEKVPSTETLLKLAKALGVTTDYLLGASKEKDILVDREVSIAFRDFKGLTLKDRVNIMDHIAYLKDKAKKKAPQK